MCVFAIVASVVAAFTVLTARTALETCGSEHREKERKSRGLCSGNGGRVYMDVSAAKSDVINVVVA